MNNKELNGLAQNRFLDEETQCAIASHKYLLCRQYLAENARLKPAARDILLAGKAVSVKWNLIRSGNLNELPDVIHSVWLETNHRFRQPWRVGYTFFTGSFSTLRTPNTPIETLKDIYLTYYRPRETIEDRSWRPEYWSIRLLDHPNLDEELALVISTSHMATLQKKAFEKLVALRKRK